MLVRHIEERLPKLRDAVMTQELKARTELESLGSAVSESNSEAMREALLRLLDLYSNAFNGRLNGRSKQRVAQDCMLQGGARIRHVFQQIFGKVLDDLDPCCGMSDEEVFFPAPSTPPSSPRLSGPAHLQNPRAAHCTSFTVY